MARGGGGAGGRMEEMARQRDAMTQKLIDALEALGKNLGGGSGGGGGAGGGGSGGGRGGGGRGRRPSEGDDDFVGPTQAAAGPNYWNKGLKGDSAAGFGISAVRSVLAGAGDGVTSSLMGGLLSGGAVGVGLAAANLASEAGKDLTKIHGAGRAAAFAAPYGSSFQEMDRRRDTAEQLASVDFAEKHGQLGGGYLISHEYGKGSRFFNKEKSEFYNDQTRRYLQREQEDRTSIQGSVADRAYSLLSNYAAAGGDFAHNKRDKDIAQQVVQALTPQATSQQALKRYLETITSTINGAQSGNQSRLGAQ